MTEQPTKQAPAILYVDDEATALKYFQRALGSLAPVYVAESVEEGKRMLDEHADEIAVLVSDQRMPAPTATSCCSTRGTAIRTSCAS